MLNYEDPDFVPEPHFHVFLDGDEKTTRLGFRFDAYRGLQIVEQKLAFEAQCALPAYRGMSVECIFQAYAFPNYPERAIETLHGSIATAAKPEGTLTMRHGIVEVRVNLPDNTTRKLKKRLAGAYFKIKPGHKDFARHVRNILKGKEHLPIPLEAFTLYIRAIVTVYYVPG